MTLFRNLRLEIHVALSKSILFLRRMKHYTYRIRLWTVADDPPGTPTKTLKERLSERLTMLSLTIAWI
jgi:hypothetical protein